MPAELGTFIVALTHNEARRDIYFDNETMQMTNLERHAVLGEYVNVNENDREPIVSQLIYIIDNMNLLGFTIDPNTLDANIFLDEEISLLLYGKYMFLSDKDVNQVNDKIFRAIFKMVSFGHQYNNEDFSRRVAKEYCKMSDKEIALLYSTSSAEPLMEKYRATKIHPIQTFNYDIQPVSELLEPLRILDVTNGIKLTTIVWVAFIRSRQKDAIFCPLSIGQMLGILFLLCCRLQSDQDFSLKSIGELMGVTIVPQDYRIFVNECYMTIKLSELAKAIISFKNLL